MGNNEPPDFSSKQYWTDRFEKESTFEWLARSEGIIPLVLKSLDEILRSKAIDKTDNAIIDGFSGRLNDPRSETSKSLNVLHFGCGSSSLGADLQEALSTYYANDSQQDSGLHLNSKIRINFRVIDADYVQPTLLSKRSIPVIQLDVLNESSLASATKEYGQWDIIVDKSTADAISCGPNATLPDGSMVEPIECLCINLAKIVRRGGKWISVSYSATRYDHLLTSAIALDGEDYQDANGLLGWRILEKIPMGSVSMPEGRMIKDGKGWRKVYEPETPVLVYVLERM